MGIYCNDMIYGIFIYYFNDNKISNILFVKMYDEQMNEEQKKEAFLFYTNLNDKNNVFFKIYTECSSTYDIDNKENFFMWYPITLNFFLDKFNVQS